MVLIRLWCVAMLAVATAACSQSLFDNTGGGGGGGGDDDGPHPATCNAPCLADAAVDFDGSAGGKNQMWRYLDDHRDRTFAAMTPGTGAMTGADPSNHIKTCAANSTAAACAMLPDALLVSTSGANTAADPAIEFTAPDKQVITLSVKAFLASGSDQTIRLYRAGRPDALFTGIATAGKLVEQTITVDALAKDRFLVAVAPTGNGAPDVAIQFIASSAGMVFPQACLLAMDFAGATGNSLSDRCASTAFTYTDDSDNAKPVVLVDDPFGQKSTAADVALGTYFQTAQALTQSTTLTVQMWIKQRAVAPGGEFAWVLSDMDLTDNAPGGLAIGVGGTPAVLQASTATVSTPTTIETTDVLTPWPGTGAWHFIRVVQSGGNMEVCLDGKRKASLPVTDGHLKTVEPLFLARNKFGLPRGESFFDGTLDDVRMFKGALPCE